MKTENKNRKSKAMKTKNNVQKTILRFAAVVISLVLISFTVSAQDFWKKLIAGSSFNAIALAMVDHSNEESHSAAVTSSSYDFNLVYETDESLSLEPWMLNDIFPGVAVPFAVNETERELEIEPWMLDEKLFEVNNSEEELKLEDWMTNNVAWN